MKSYNFLFAITSYFEYGGVQRDLRHIAEKCVQRGHRVEIVTGSWSGNRPNGITIRIVSLDALTNHGKNDKLAELVGRIRREEDFDCYVGFNKIAGLDVYYAGDACLAEKWSQSKPRFVRQLPRYKHFLQQEADVFGSDKSTDILLIAHQEKSRFVRHYGTADHRFHLLPPGIDRDRLLQARPTGADNAAFRDLLGVGSYPNVLLMVGSGFKTKGVDRSILALRSLPEELRLRCALLVVGKGNKDAFERLAGKHGISKQVVFTGPRDDVGRLYHAADLLVHPAYSENTGTAILEALVCGLPALTTANCGYAIHVEKANAGIVCPMPFQQAQFNQLLERALSKADRENWIKNALTYCRQNDLYSLFERSADIIIERARKNRMISGQSDTQAGSD